jgi:hypothetical protein
LLAFQEASSSLLAKDPDAQAFLVQKGYSLTPSYKSSKSSVRKSQDEE